uniref:Uncharacterized protein n=1 Tax=Anopheles culicifacies TaxID=139723 RepID=A0A182LZN6_9DIPT
MGLASSKAVSSIAVSSHGTGPEKSNGRLSKDSVIVETNYASMSADMQQPCSILPSPSGSSSIDTWKTSSCHVRQASIRSRNLQPMPDAGELDRRFAKVLSLPYVPLREFQNIHGFVANKL